VARTFQCTLVTPHRQVFDEQVTHVTIPAHDGQIGVLPSRAPLMVKLGYGPLRVDVASGGGGAGGTRWYCIGGGFAQMKGNRLSLVASEATTVDEIDRQEAQAALKEAQARVTHSDAEFDLNQRDQARARTMLQLLGR
jgi:F-type H+-transporting ATPase subunit epsilon